MQYCNHSPTTNQSNHTKRSRERISPSDEEGTSCDRRIAKKLDRSCGKVETVNPARLRARRAAVSSVANNNAIVHSDDSNSSDSEMPMKKNTFKITAKFIGSLQKHSNQKARAERAAAAAAVALAAHLTDPGR